MDMPSSLETAANLPTASTQSITYSNASQISTNKVSPSLKYYLGFSGWIWVVIISLLPVFLMFLSNFEIQSVQTFYMLFKTLGDITGLAGICMYSINLILSTRLKIFEDYFGGMNRVYIAHHIIGGISLVLLLFHPLLLAIKYLPSSVYSAATLLIPQFNGGWMEYQWAINYGIFALFGMLFLLLLTFYIKLPYQLWLLTHKLLGVFFVIGVLHFIFISPTSNVDSLTQYYILTISALGIFAYAYRTLFGKILIRSYDFTVVAMNTYSTSKDVYDIYLSPLKKFINFQPGQFIYASFRQKGISPEWHPFTISSSEKYPFLRLTIKGLGNFTSQLGKIQKGTTVKIEGAFGKFSYKNFHNPNQIWIAGGIGITPFLSMAPDVIQENCHVDLYYSVNKESELIGYYELNQLIAKIPQNNFRLIPFLSERQGYLTAQYIVDTSQGFEGKDIFLCGPPAMMKSLKVQLKNKGVPSWRIHSEEFAML